MKTVVNILKQWNVKNGYQDILVWGPDYTEFDCHS